MNKRIEELENLIRKERKILSHIEEKSIKNKLSYEEFVNVCNPYCKKINEWDRELRTLIEPIELDKPLGGSIMDIEHFISICKSGGFIDSDGFGRYISKNDLETDIDIYPSDIKHNQYRKDMDKIIWYNK